MNYTSQTKSSNNFAKRCTVFWKDRSRLMAFVSTNAAAARTGSDSEVWCSKDLLTVKGERETSTEAGKKAKVFIQFPLSLSLVRRSVGCQSSSKRAI